MSSSWRMRASTFFQLCETAKRVYPHEFISMLGVSGEDPFLISDIVVLPAEFGLTHSGFRTDLIPFDPKIVGTVHSHPSPSAEASAQDVSAFSRLGAIHVILAYPYDLSHFRAYSAQGKRIPLRVVGD